MLPVCRTASDVKMGGKYSGSARDACRAEEETPSPPLARRLDRAHGASPQSLHLKDSDVLEEHYRMRREKCRVCTWTALVVVTYLWAALSKCYGSIQEGHIPQDVSALIASGDAHRARSQYEQAVALYEQALSMAQQGKDRASEGRVLDSLGHVYGELRQYERAIAFY